MFPSHDRGGFTARFIWKLIKSPTLRLRFGELLTSIADALPDARTPQEAFAMATFVAEGRKILRQIEDTPNKQGGFVNFKPGDAELQNTIDKQKAELFLEQQKGAKQDKNKVKNLKKSIKTAEDSLKDNG